MVDPRRVPRQHRTVRVLHGLRQTLASHPHGLRLGPHHCLLLLADRIHLELHVRPIHRRTLHLPATPSLHEPSTPIVAPHHPSAATLIDTDNTATIPPLQKPAHHPPNHRPLPARPAMGARLARLPLAAVAVPQRLRAVALEPGQRAHLLAGVGRLLRGLRTGELQDPTDPAPLAVLAVSGRDLLRHLPDARALRPGHQADLSRCLDGRVPGRWERGPVSGVLGHHGDRVYRRGLFHHVG